MKYPIKKICKEPMIPIEFIEGRWYTCIKGSLNAPAQIQKGYTYLCCNVRGERALYLVNHFGNLISTKTVLSWGYCFEDVSND